MQNDCFMFVLLYSEYLCGSEMLTLWVYSFINNNNPNRRQK